MNVDSIIALLLFSITGIKAVESYKILILAADGGSHVLYNGKLAESLVQRGHHVTFVTGSTQKIPEHLRLNDGITIDSYHNPDKPFISKPENIKPLLEAAVSGSLIDLMSSVNVAMTNNMMTGFLMLNDTEFLSRVEKASYDFIICDFIIQPFLILPYKLGIPFAILGADCRPFTRRLFYVPSHVPQLFTTYTDNMTFMQRTWNLLAYILEYIVVTNLSSMTDKVIQYVPEKEPVSLTDLLGEADLCITLRENMIDFVRPTLPDVVSMATLLASPAEPLPNDLDLFMTNAKEGVILVTFGSWLDILPDSVLQKLLAGFSQLSYKVLFKYANEIEHLHIPTNVKVLPWVPQNDLLGHKHVKLFVTHCGLNGLIEGTYHGVPLLAFPLVGDQPSNAAIAKSKNIAEILTIHDFTPEQLTSTINKMIDDKSYRTNAQRLSTAFKDLIQSNTVNPAFWIEHVIKYGSNHIRPRGALELAWYQYIMLDTIFALACVFLFSSVCIYKLICKVCKIRHVSKKQKNE